MPTDLQRPAVDVKRGLRPAGIGWVLATVLLIALNLRIAVTSSGALLDQLESAIGLSAGHAAFLTTLPVLCFAVVGAMGMGLSRRMGAHRGLLVALALLVVGQIVRVLAGSSVLLLGTFIACAGIALANVLVPPVVKEHFPNRVGQVTGAYSAVLSAGSAFGAAATVPVAQAMGGWRAGLGIWALVALLALVAWLPHCRQKDHGAGVVRGDSMLRSPIAWAVTLLFASQSIFAYVVMGWLPSIYVDAGFTHSTAGLLLAVSILVGVPVFLVAPTLATRMRSQGHLVALLTGMLATGFAGLALEPVGGAWVWAVLLGAGGAVFPVTLTLFALRTGSAADTASLSAMAQSVGYLLAASGPLLMGLLRDATGSWSVPLGLLVLLCVVQGRAGYVAGRPRVIGVATGDQQVARAYAD